MMDNIDKIILHCSDSDHPEHDDISVIRGWHLARGFKCEGYHYFIKMNGDIQLGRPIWQAGAHTENHNNNSIGICYAGKSINEKQFETMKKLVANLRYTYGLKKSEVYPHNYFNKAKTCPNFDINKLFISENV